MKYSKLTQSIVSYIFVMILIASSLIILHPTKVYAAENVKFSFTNSETYNYNIEGDVRTSYNNNGYITILKVGDTAQKVTGSNNGEATIDGVTIKTEYISKQNGTYAGVVYTIENTNTTSKKMYLGEGLDVQIGTNDKAPVTVLDNGRGFYMEDSGHMFNVLLRNTYGSTDVTGIWIGSYSEYKNLRDANNFFISQEKNYSGGDSAAFWYWEYTLEPGEVKTFSHSIGVGELNNPPEISDITGVGTNHCTGDLINVSGYVSDENKTDTVNVKYSFDDGTENTLATNIATNGSKKHFNGTITVPSIDSGKHKLTIYAEDNNGNISKAITKEFEAHTIPDIYMYQTNNGIENGIRYKQCTNCGKIIDKEYLLSLDKTAGIEAVTGGGYYKEGKKIVVSAKLGNASGFKCWSGSDLTKQEAIYTMPAQAMKLTATSFYKNKYEHWAWGFKNEGNNSNKTAFLLQTTYGEETYGEEFTPDATYGLTVPNGFYLVQRFGTGQITGKWTTFNFGTKLTQPAYVMNFEYDYYPTDYTITYNLDGGTNSSSNPDSYTVLYGVTFSNPTKAGYDFAGWYDANGNKITGINEGCNATFSDTADLYSKLKTRKTGNVSITAKWTPHNYTISYNLNGGTANNKTSYTIETEKFTLNAPTKKGYTFAGWTGSNGTTAQKSVSIDKGTTGNKSYTANWTPINYTITYNLDGGTISGQKTSYTIETATFTLPQPTKKGYTFVGWTGSNGTNLSLTVTIPKGSTENKSYKAHWRANKLIVTYNKNGGIIDKTMNNYSQDINGFSQEWQYNHVNANGGTTEDPINFSSFGLKRRDGYVRRDGAEWNTKPDGTGRSYDQDKSYTMTQFAPELEKGDVNLVLYAQWQPAEYSITYDLKGGSLSNQKTSYNVETATFTLPQPTKKGCTFVGWTGSNGTTPQKTVSIAKGSTGNKSYTAIFEKTIYTITTSKVGSGALSDISKVEYDDGTSVFIIPAEGYTTSSLKIDGVSVSPVTKYNFLNVNKDHKVEATFTISQNRKMELMQKGYSWINLKL